MFNPHSMVFCWGVSILGSVFSGIVILMFFISRNLPRVLEKSLMEGAKQAISASVNDISATALQVEHVLHSVQTNLNKLDRADTPKLKNILLSEMKPSSRMI